MRYYLPSLYRTLIRFLRDILSGKKKEHILFSDIINVGSKDSICALGISSEIQRAQYSKNMELHQAISWYGWNTFLTLMTKRYQKGSICGMLQWRSEKIYTLLDQRRTNEKRYWKHREKGWSYRNLSSDDERNCRGQCSKA